MRRRTPDHVSVAAIAKGGLAVVAAIVFCTFAAIALVHPGSPTLPHATRVATPEMASPPALQAQPAEDIAQYRAQKERVLDEYAWIDRKSGTVRIPIERAMVLLVQQNASGAHR